MPYDTRFRSRGSLFYSSIPNGVRWLILANVGVYLVDFFGSMVAGEPIFRAFALSPSDVLRRAEVWQLVTYMFLHSLQSFWHILFNMLTLWMFGSPVEQTWGTRRFLRYYFICGIGAGLCVVLANLFFPDPRPTIGASGAIYGLLLAYGMLFPNQEVLFAFLFPLKAKYMVAIFGAIAFLSSFQGGGAVSNLAHLGGMIFGFLYIRSQFAARGRSRVGGGSGFDLGALWKEYKLRRARRKFQVYMKKQDSRRGPWVN